jgi:hypothetical protein
MSPIFNKKYFIYSVFLIALVTSVPSFSQSDSIKINKLKFISGSNEARLNLPLSINPDFYCLKIARWGAKWSNSIGNTIGLINYEGKKIKITLSISGFIELHDFDKYQFMSWQLWRGNLGSSVFFNLPYFDNFLNKKGRLVIETGWYHESQHVTDLTAYAIHFLDLNSFNPYSFPNADIRSFEYYVIGFCYDWQTENKQWRLFFNPRYRQFPNTLLRNERILINAYSAEFGIHRKLSHYANLYAQGFYEKINNSFEAKKNNYVGNWNKEPFVYQNIEIGLIFQNKEKRQFNLFLNYSRSNGRGLDFINVYIEYGLGFRIVL